MALGGLLATLLVVTTAGEVPTGGEVGAGGDARAEEVYGLKGALRVIFRDWPFGRLSPEDAHGTIHRIGCALDQLHVRGARPVWKTDEGGRGRDFSKRRSCI
jgi:hypothetical protein